MTICTNGIIPTHFLNDFGQIRCRIPGFGGWDIYAFLFLCFFFLFLIVFIARYLLRSYLWYGSLLGLIIFYKKYSSKKSPIRPLLIQKIIVLYRLSLNWHRRIQKFSSFWPIMKLLGKIFKYWFFSKSFFLWIEWNMV